MNEQSITIKKAKNKYNVFDVKMKLTAGKILAIKHALELHKSPVGEDVLDLLKDALKNCPEVENI